MKNIGFLISLPKSFLKKREETVVKGFTLVEMVVSIVIMGIVLTAVLSAIGNFIQTSRTLDTMRHLQQETIFALNRMADKIRSHGIHYNDYQAGGACEITGASIGSASDICLGNGWKFFLDSDRVYIQKSAVGSSTQEAPLFSDDVKVTNLLFEVTPVEDPNASSSWGEESLQKQPLVHISLSVQSAEKPALFFDIETSISSRVY